MCTCTRRSPRGRGIFGTRWPVLAVPTCSAPSNRDPDDDFPSNMAFIKLSSRAREKARRERLRVDVPCGPPSRATGYSVSVTSTAAQLRLDADTSRECHKLVFSELHKVTLPTQPVAPHTCAPTRDPALARDSALSGFGMPVARPAAAWEVRAATAKGPSDAEAASPCVAWPCGSRSRAPRTRAARGLPVSRG